MSDSLQDVIGPDLAVLFCGINPGATAAAAGHSFVSPSNRFWRAIHQAGFTPVQLTAEQDQSLLAYGCGLTAAVGRPTRSAGELSRAELAAAADGLRAKVENYAPRTIAFLGKAAYAAISGQRQVEWGLQPMRFGGALVWILPNPSGLNRAFSLADLVQAYHALWLAVRQDLPAGRENPSP